jgi:hypothetical protein
VGLDEGAYAARVEAAIGGEVELLGSSPAALATAVKRALASAGNATDADDA